MAVKGFLHQLTHLDRMRVTFETRTGKIVDFVVQQESYISNRWVPLVRYNLAHGTPHRDTLHPDGTQEKEWFPSHSPAEVLTMGVKDIKENYKNYRAKYERSI